ncbi:MAG: FtsW/RodA/SpoVE family cell cycle protein [Bacillota bacterium]
MKKCDKFLIVIIVLLLAIGIIEVFSSSYYLNVNDSSNSILISHIRSVLIGLFSMIVFFLIPYKFLSKIALFLIFPLFIGFILLETNLGISANGSVRWVRLPGFTYMPSEWAKLFVIIIMAKLLSMRKKFIKKFFVGILPYFIFISIVVFLIYIQPNMSDAVIVLGISAGMIFIAGMKWIQIIGLSGLGAGLLWYMIKSSSYRYKRFLTFKDPFEDPIDFGWQNVQSLYALGSGGFFGVGLGLSTQNKLYLPEPQNDFILATIAEEWGYLGIVLLLTLYCLLIYKGFKIALKTNDLFGFFLASGITLMIALHVIINFLVIGSLMPVTGITLPLISFGGNSILVVLSSLGILLNISKSVKSEV